MMAPNIENTASKLASGQAPTVHHARFDMGKFLVAMRAIMLRPRSSRKQGQLSGAGRDIEHRLSGVSATRASPAVKGLSPNRPAFSFLCEIGRASCRERVCQYV